MRLNPNSRASVVVRMGPMTEEAKRAERVFIVARAARETIATCAAVEAFLTTLRAGTPPAETTEEP